MDDLDDRFGLVAVVLAGGARDQLAEEAGVATRALVPVGGRAMGTYVLDALAVSRRVKRVVLVGAEGLSGLTDVRLPGGEGLMASLSHGCAAAAQFGPKRLLILSADLPWLTGPAIDRWVEGAPLGDLVYPVIPESASVERFPGQRRTKVRLRSGRYTGGNLFLVLPSVLPQLLPWIDRAYRARKNPLALARMIGFWTAASLAMGLATLQGLERSVGRSTGLDVRVDVTEEAAIGADVDHPEHLSAAMFPSMRSPT